MSKKYKLTTGEVESIKNDTERDAAVENILKYQGEALIVNLNTKSMTIHVITKGTIKCNSINNPNAHLYYNDNRVYVLEKESEVIEIVNLINLSLSNKIKRVKYCGICGHGRTDLTF